jgi:hypothetical protein
LRFNRLALRFDILLRRFVLVKRTRTARFSVLKRFLGDQFFLEKVFIPFIFRISGFGSDLRGFFRRLILL